MTIEPHGARLFAQVGVLAARHLMQVDVRRAGPDVGLERGVVAAHALPVGRDGFERLDVDSGIAGRAAQGRGNRSQVGLRGQPAHRIEGAVNGVGAGVDRRQRACRADAARVVGVEVDRQADRVLERADEGMRRSGPADSGHVLDAEHLDLDVTRPADELLQTHLVVAEGGLRLSAGHVDGRGQVGLGLDHTHAAAAAAPARLEHHG
jgi:hypothetical protein